MQINKYFTNFIIVFFFQKINSASLSSYIYNFLAPSLIITSYTLGLILNFCS
jgi:hypothetical protein